MLQIKFYNINSNMKGNDSPFKVSDLFSPRGEASQSYFYASNKIISDPSLVLNFFRDFSDFSTIQQEQVLTQLITIIETVSTNAYTLNVNSQRSIIEQIIELLPSQVENYLIFGKLLTVLNYLLKMSELKEQIISKAIKKNICEFYDSRVDSKTIFASINVLKGYFKAKTDMEKQPPRMMIFHGSRGLEICPITKKKDTTWLFSQGMSVCLWINTQNIKFGNQVPLPKLFTFYSPNHGGLESYLIDNKIYYRMVGAKYSQPSIGSNGILVGQLQPNKWNFLCFQHEGSKTFSKSKLTFYLNKNKSNFNIDPPKISSSQKTKYIFFDRIYCKSSSVCVFPIPIGSAIVEELNKNLNSINSLKNPKAFIFQQKQGKLYERSGFGYCDTRLIQKRKEMNFKIALPFFYLLKYVDNNEYPLLDQILSIFIQFLCKSSANQVQSYSQNYMKMISELMKDIPSLSLFFNKDTINVLLSIKQTITNKDLLDQYYSDFLWPLVSSPIQIARKQQILQIIKNSFTLRIADFTSLIGLDEMINTIVGMETKTTKCCEKHYKVLIRRFDKEIQPITHFGEEEVALNYILQMIQLYFEDGKINCAFELYKLCRLLMLKFSPCFTLSLISVIKKIITQKFNEKLNKDQSKKIIKLFTEKKVHLIFLHAIENNFFAEIKAESTKIIYQLLLKKSSSIQQIEVSRKIAEALWKINEQRQFESPVRAMTNSLKRRSSQLQQVLLEPEMKNNKFALDIQPEEKQEQDQKKEFKVIGPQAPKLTNREKGNKKFNFNFVNETNEQKDEPIIKKQEEIMEEEKTNQNQIVEEELQLFEPPQIKKKKKGFSLSINTQAINEMYTFGGQKGQQIMISEQQETNELQKIKSLAKKCLAAMKGQKQSFIEEEASKSVPKYIPPPSTTSNKVLKARERQSMVLQLIDEDQDQSGKKPVSQSSPNYNNKSLRSPSSLNSLSEENLVILYNSLLECCLGMSFHTMALEDSKIKVPSVLYVFFNWIPQTNLEVKFINDLDIIFDTEENLKIVTEMPQLYDFLCELIYKSLVFEEEGEKRVYMEKLQTLIKKVWSYIFRKDSNGLDKFAFVFEWTTYKANQYDPKCLFFTSRLMILYLISSIQEQIGTNAKIDQQMTESFETIGMVIEHLRKFLPSQNIHGIFFDKDQSDRIMFHKSFQMINSLAPLFSQRQWVDYLVCEKYQMLFKKYFCTNWFKKSLSDYQSVQEGNLSKIYKNIEESLKKMQITAEANYFLRNQYLYSIIQINRSLFIDKMQENQQQKNDERQLVWLTILLVLFSEVVKEKVNKVSSAQLQLVFLKNCKFFSAQNIQNATNIVPILMEIRSIIENLNRQSMTSSQDLRSSSKIPVSYTNNSNALQNLMNEHIKEQLFTQTNSTLKSFKLNFDDIWLPSEGHFKKLKSQTFHNFKQKIQDSQNNTISYIEHISDIIEEQIQRSHSTQILVQASNRVTRNQFRKLWRNLQIFNSVWTHPNFNWQNDILFNKNTFSFERYQPSEYFKYKISKHLSKYRFRYMLKPRLIEPQITKETFQIEKSEQIGLDKALIYSIKRLSIGKRLLNWVIDKNDEGIQILLHFKKVRLVKTLTIRHGYIGILNDKIVFITAYEHEKQNHLSIDQFKLRKNKTIHKVWPLQLVKQIFKRRFLNQSRALQLTFINGKSIFLDFYQNNAKQFIDKIFKYKAKCVNLIYQKSLDPKAKQVFEPLQKKWMTYQISNFEYIQQINNLAGRSYSDLTQYPVFPWVLTNFSNKLSLANEQNYRNLTLPMGALGTPERTQQFRMRYEEMMPDQNDSKFHYGTHYSSPGIVYHFLVRVSPFSEGSYLLQGGKFDFADRLFFSISDSYKNATSQYSDVRQLVPEMYTIPEIYLNLNKIDFGVMQNKKRVHNVELPEWSRQNPYLYITKMRRGFEDSSVSKSVSKWIDLIFGFKQRGEQAVKNINCFVSITYEDAINFEQVETQKQLISLQTQILNFGQTPSLIFKKQHPERPHASTAKYYNVICDYISEPRTYRPSRNSASLDLLKDERELNPLRQIDKSIIHMKWFKESSLVFMRRNGEMLFYKWYSNTNPNNKAPFQCSVDKERKVERINKIQYDGHECFDPSLNVQSFPIQFINSGHHIILGGLADGKLQLIDVDTNHVVESYSNHNSTVCSLKADSKDNFLITGDISGRVIVWRITSNHKLSCYGTFSDHTQQINSFYISYDLMSFVSASEDGTVYMYNLMTGKKMRVYYHPKGLPISHALVSTSPLPVVIVFCNVESIIYCYSINGQLIQRIHEKEIQHFISPIIMKDSSGFQYISYGNELGQAIIRTLPFLDNPKKQVVVKDASVNRVCVSKSGKFIITGCSDGELSVITVPQLTSS